MQIEQGVTAAVVTGAASGLGRASAYALAGAGAKVAVFDINEDGGRAVADDIGGIFCKVNILDEDSVLDGFALAREAHGQERVLVHCAVAAKGGKTVGKDRETGGWKRLSTEDYAFAAMGVLVASYRMTSISALGSKGEFFTSAMHFTLSRTRPSPMASPGSEKPFFASTAARSMSLTIHI